MFQNNIIKQLKRRKIMEEIKRDVEFLVFEDKGVVVCKLHNCKYVALKRIDKYTGGKLVIKIGGMNNE